MPARADIQQEILSVKGGYQDIVRRRFLKELSKHTGHDTVLYASSFAVKRPAPAFAHQLSIQTPDIQGFMAALHGLKGSRLDLIIHSPGGSLEAAEQIINYLRQKYDYLRAIIPQNAMSAATMIACACDEIVMGKQSALGPTDPQVTFPFKDTLYSTPVQSLLAEFEQAKQEVKRDPATAAIWATKVRDYPPGILATCVTVQALARERVETWLTQYMFKGQKDGPAKAAEIASWLRDPDSHKTHSRPIGLEMAIAKGLRVIPLENDHNLQDLVLSVFHATMLTFELTPCIKFVESHEGRGWFINQPT